MCMCVCIYVQKFHAEFVTLPGLSPRNSVTSNVYSGRQSREEIYKMQRFGDQLHLHHQGGEMQVVSETSGFYNSPDAALCPKKKLY